MSVVVALRTNGAAVTAAVDGEVLAGPTPLEDLPGLERLQADPFELGKGLTAALGDDGLLRLLEADPDRLLLLDADGESDAVPWEFAVTAGRELLVTRFGLLRLVDRDAPPAVDGPVQFVALAADPLVDQQGNGRDDFRLDVDTELRAVGRVLRESGQRLFAGRIAPTREALRRGLLRGPAILHLSCHGNVIETPDGPVAVLLLEDENGGAAPLPGQDLTAMPPPGVLRMVLLSACKTASGDEARLARALVRQGVPLAIGMQGSFLDALSDELAEAFYRTLLAGYSAAEALRQARLALFEQAVGQTGLPAGYVARGAWGPLPLADGQPEIAQLRLPGVAALPPEVQPPRPLLGRGADLHGLARLYSQGKHVVTIAGTGGVGKTALAAAFAERFAWRWHRGVRAISFAVGEVDDGRFRDELLRALGLDPAAVAPAGGADQQTALILDTAGRQAGELLLVLDNYESVLQDNEAGAAAAEAVHRLVYQMAECGVSLMLTSRERPAGLRDEVVFPSNNSLPGLPLPAAARLFLEHSTKAKSQRKGAVELAASVAEATEGHPLAVALLAGEWDTSEVPPEQFLGDWADELAAAQRKGLAGHHRTFAAAFARSYDRLPDELRSRLRALSLYEFPFFAEAAALVWGGDTSEQGVAEARETLGRLVRLSLLDVHAFFEDDTAATYRFQPALRQEVARRVGADEPAAHEAGYATYGVWLAERGYSAIHRDPSLAQLVRLSLDAMHAAVDTLQGTDQLWHVRRLAWLLAAYGETPAACDLLTRFLPPGHVTPDAEADPERCRAHSGLCYESARLEVTCGDLSRAEQLYQEGLGLSEQIGDRQGKAASLHQMAGIYLTRGDLSRAEQLYQESLDLDEQIGDRGGKATSLHNLAEIYLTRGDLPRAEQLYQESLDLKEQIGDLIGMSNSKRWLAVIAQRRGDLDTALGLYDETLQIAERIGDACGRSSSLHQIAGIYRTRGDLSRAEQLYQESLDLKEQIGDRQGKAASLADLAVIYRTRGDLPRAEQLYQESLDLYEQIGDRGGKAGALSMFSNVYWQRRDFDRAEGLLREAIELSGQVGDLQAAAFNTVKLGQLTEVRGQGDEALAQFREGLALCERIGMAPLAEQVRGLIAGLESGGAAGAETSDPLGLAVAEARSAAGRGDWPAAIQSGEQAVQLTREAGENRESLVGLSVLLYNVADYYRGAERFDDAVRALQEVVALDERTGHEDLESDRQTLQQTRKMAALTPEQRAELREQAEQARKELEE